MLQMATLYVLFLFTEKYLITCLTEILLMLQVSLQPSTCSCAGVVFYSVTCASVAQQSTNGKPIATVELKTV